MMQPEVWNWAAAVAASGALAIWGKDPRRMLVHWVFKPLTMLLVMGALWRLAPATPLRLWLLAALSLSLVGDVALMASMRWFKLGLAAFLASLMTYALAFSRGVPFTLAQPALLLVPLAVAVPMLRRVLPHVPKMRPAVIAYVAALVIMAWRLLARYADPGVSNLAYVWGVMGAGLFMLSDSLLSLRRFAGRELSYPVELGSYFAAQWCLASAAWV